MCGNFMPRWIYPGERAPGTHWIRDWVTSKAGVNALEKRESLVPGANRTPIHQSCGPYSKPFTDKTIHNKEQHIKFNYREITGHVSFADILGLGPENPMILNEIPRA
jgi:hypothetical protein